MFQLPFTRRRRRTLRELPALLGLVFLVSTLGPGQCSSKGSLAALPPTPLNIIVSERLFSAANRNDAVGAMKIWSDLTSCIVHLNIVSTVDVIGSQSEIRRRVLDGTVDVLILDGVEFVRLSDAGLVEGIAVTSEAGHSGAKPYLLLVNQQTHSLSQLRSKRAIFYLRTDSAASLAWIATLLAQNHLGRAETFFGPSEISTKASNCILPLFFGRVDACVVSSGDWEVAKEMNPQLGKQLKILAQSSPVLDGVSALPRKPSAHRQQIIATTLTMHSYPAGSQILAVFKSGPMIAYRPEYLDSTRKFWDDYIQILTPAELAGWNESARPIVPREFKRKGGSLGDLSESR